MQLAVIGSTATAIPASLVTTLLLEGTDYGLKQQVDEIYMVFGLMNWSLVDSF